MTLAVTEALLPEELVIAVLHKVGAGSIVVDDMRLAEIFHEAANKFGGIYKTFRWHPQYRYSKRLTDAFQALDHGGSIKRDNPASTYFTVTPHTAGLFGASLFEKLSRADQVAATEIAEQIRTTFGAPNVPK